MKYVIASTIVTDEIHFYGREEPVTVPGGAGIYALAGARLFADDVVPVPGGGEDFAALFGKWFADNAISMEHVTVTTEHTPQNIIQYFADGERSETPRFGFAHYHTAEVRPEYLEEAFREADGIYIFRNADSAFWDSVLSMKRDSRAKVLWEIALDAARPGMLREVRRIAESVEILSINRTEAKALTGKDEEGALEVLSSWDVPLIFYRRGAEGSVMLAGGEKIEVPAKSGVKVVDPTGGGNSSSGAVLVGYCEGKCPAECALMGNLAAQMCIEVYGVPERITPKMRQAALKYIQAALPSLTKDSCDFGPETNVQES